MKGKKKVVSFFAMVSVLSGCGNVMDAGMIDLQQMASNSLEKINQFGEKVSLLGLPASVMIDAPHIRQLPELARGCEVTSLAMLLQYAGVQVDKMTLAKEIKKETVPYQVKNGEIYYGNPNKGFVGDIYSFQNRGYAVYNEPIFELGEVYLPEGLVNLTGESFNEVYRQLAKGNPVWVITTSTFEVVEADKWEKWNTPEGDIYITLKEHAVLVTGYDEEFLYINNPLGGKNEAVEKEPFIAGWEQLGFQAITLK